MNYNGLRSGESGVGNVYMVSQASANNSDYIDDHYQTTYLDGSTAVQATIPLALTATITERNDYVIVLPDDTAYALAATLTMDKMNVHLICPSGLGYDIGALRSATLNVTGNVHGITMSKYAQEVAGFFIKSYDGKSHIAMSAGTYTPSIHHNTLALIWTTTAASAIMGSGTAGAWGSIERNYIVSMSGTSKSLATYGVINIEGQATGARVCHNHVSIGDGNTVAFGIKNNASKGITAHNVVSESGGDHGSSGTVTVAIRIEQPACAVGNLCAVGDGQGVTAGVADHSYVENYEASDGGSLAI